MKDLLTGFLWLFVVGLVVGALVLSTMVPVGGVTITGTL